MDLSCVYLPSSCLPPSTLSVFSVEIQHYSLPVPSLIMLLSQGVRQCGVAGYDVYLKIYSFVLQRIHMQT